jgi:hypothetical protein
MDDAYALALAFDTNASEFIRGVEVGRLWEQLKSEQGPIEEVVHASNAEMVLRLSEATDRAVRAEELDETWLQVTFDAA